MRRRILPLPQGEGECQFSQLGAYPDAYGGMPSIPSYRRGLHRRGLPGDAVRRRGRNHSGRKPVRLALGRVSAFFNLAVSAFAKRVRRTRLGGRQVYA